MERQLLRKKHLILHLKPDILIGKILQMRRRTKILIIVGAVVLVLVAAALMVFFVWKNKVGKQISGIYVSTYPQKTEYYVGDLPAFEDLSVMVTRNNGDFYTVGAGECEITGFDSSAPADRQKIAVSYQGFTCYFTVKIVPQPQPVKMLASIAVTTLPKTQYTVGEGLDTAGGVLTLYYSNGSSFRISLLNRYVSGFNGTAPNDALVLTVRYSENGVLCETTYTVTVSEA